MEEVRSYNSIQENGDGNHRGFRHRFVFELWIKESNMEGIAMQEKLLEKFKELFGAEG